ncbi:MAG: hypothetical protein JW836_12970 [Deltaproteobacteria bacterium]|nr:hypothetical protein [Deltaproteobacteria bacterium]
MRITVFLYLDFRKFSPDSTGRVTLDAPDKADLLWVLAALKIPPERRKVLLVDGRQRRETEPLKEGETISIYPVLEGG